jgi:DNA-directed RNA polymerase subunit RPC12/RpoP
MKTMITISKDVATEINRCPRCGSGDVKMHRFWSEENLTKSYVKCEACGYSPESASFYSDTQALNYWNEIPPRNY